jgi:hypothetical protein
VEPPKALKECLHKERKKKGKKGRKEGMICE